MNGITAVTMVGIGVILLIILYGFFASFGTKVNEDFQTTAFMCTNTSAFFNQTSNQCETSATNNTVNGQITTAGQASLNVTSGMIIAGQQTPTIASVGGFVVIIALLALVAAYALGAFR